MADTSRGRYPAGDQPDERKPLGLVRHLARRTTQSGLAEHHPSVGPQPSDCGTYHSYSKISHQPSATSRSESANSLQSRGFPTFVGSLHHDDRLSTVSYESLSNDLALADSNWSNAVAAASAAWSSADHDATVTALNGLNAAQGLPWTQFLGASPGVRLGFRFWGDEKQSKVRLLACVCGACMKPERRVRFEVGVCTTLSRGDLRGVRVRLWSYQTARSTAASRLRGVRLGFRR